MRFTLPWLKEHLETQASLDGICEKLTMLGIEVEAVTDPGAELAAFSVGYVREARQHPNADRLRLCTVETRHGVFEVVCGAPNARTGMKVVFAPEGSVIPASGEVLKKAVIRGVPSVGMLCSARELGLGDEHDGIIELPETAEVGEPAVRALGLEGPVIEVGLTPNRSDCFGVAGIARDLAAAGMGRLRPRDFAPVPAQGPAGIGITLDFPRGDEAACPLFVGRMIRGVRNGPSPSWLQRRLKAIGLRPISALVDITNYLTFDLARPLHVFDASRLQGDITLRFGRLGEELVALDGKTYRLDDGMTVIADASGPISLGGIMGGESTGVTAETRDILLEAALFSPLRTAATGRRLGIESDARTRFERGLDAELVLPATELATRLILELCGGGPGEVVVAGAVPPPAEPVRFRRARLPSLAGIEVEAPEIDRTLNDLGFGLEGGPDEWSVTAPSWRHDISSEACIVEELARLHGYDRIAPVPVTREKAVGAPVLTANQRRRNAVRRTIAVLGYAEAVTWSFIPPDWAVLFGAERPVLKRNPLNAELSAMRPSLLPNLAAAAARNLARKHEAGALFEIGPRFTGPLPGEQVWTLAGLRFGSAEPRQWAQRSRPVDVIDVKGDAYAALKVLGIKPESVQVVAEAPPWYHPGRSGCLRQGRTLLATFGELHPRVLKVFDLSAPVAAFEIDLDQVPQPKQRGGKARPPLEALPFPPVDRDFAFIVDQDVPAARLLDAIRGADRQLVREVRLFDVYAGANLGEGRKSLAIGVRLQAGDRTLTEAEIEAVTTRIVAAAERAAEATLRQ